MDKSPSELRQQRKNDHLRAVRALGGDEPGAGFDDIWLVPNAVAETDWDDVSLQTRLGGIPLSSPIIINAMTGGSSEARDVNRRLAAIARRHGLAMALGSAKAALSDPALVDTYTVARATNPDGILIANVGMGSTLADAAAAVRLVEANLLQVHWNVGQELFMPEGDRNFRGALARFSEVAEGVGIPVIAKEVGQGIAASEARRLADAGARAIDVGGFGGTNFLEVEAWRSGHPLAREWATWGIPTAAAVAESVAAVGSRVDIIASGGIRDGHDIAKAMALGAQAVGIAGPVLRALSQPDGEAAVDGYLDHLHHTLRTILVMTGSANWTALRTRPVVILGWLQQWLEMRGFTAFIQALGQR